MHTAIRISEELAKEAKIFSKIELITVGSHGNYYRDLKFYMKNS